MHAARCHWNRLSIETQLEMIEIREEVYKSYESIKEVSTDKLMKQSVLCDIISIGLCQREGDEPNRTFLKDGTKNLAIFIWLYISMAM